VCLYITGEGHQIDSLKPTLEKKRFGALFAGVLLALPTVIFDPI